MKYYNNIIVNVIRDFDYLVKLNEFFEDYFDESSVDEYRFPRDSMLHEFLRWIIEEIIWEEMDKVLKEMDLQYSSMGEKREVNWKKFLQIGMDIKFDFSSNM